METEAKFLENYDAYLPDIERTLGLVKSVGADWIGTSHDMGKFTKGKDEIFRDFKAVILEAKIYRQLMREDDKGENYRECQALDGCNGSKYGKCSACPYKDFHGDEKPECSEYRTLLIRRDGQEEPEQISVPSASLKNFYKYGLGLSLGRYGVPMPLFAVVTLFTAVGHKKGSRKWATIEFEAGRPVKNIAKLVEYKKEHSILFLLKSSPPTPAIEAPKTTKVNTVVTEAETGKKIKFKGEVIETTAEEVGDGVEELEAKLEELEDIDV